MSVRPSPAGGEARATRRLHPAPGSVLLLLVYVASSMLASLLAAAVAGSAASGAAQFFSDWMPILLASPWLIALPLLLGPGCWLAGLERQDLGLRSPRPWRDLTLGTLLGLALLLLPGSVAVFSGGYIPVVSLPGLGAGLDGSVGFIGSATLYELLGLAMGLGFAAFGEELLCRGLLLRYWQPVLGRHGAVVVSAGLFTAMHAANPAVSVLGLVGVLLSGLLLGLVFMRSSSMGLVTGLHFGWNFATTSVLGLPVSGMQFASLSRWQSSQSPFAQLWFGGEFGPEEGLAFHAVLVAALLLVWRRRVV